MSAQAECLSPSELDRIYNSILEVRDGKTIADLVANFIWLKMSFSLTAALYEPRVVNISQNILIPFNGQGKVSYSMVSFTYVLALAVRIRREDMPLMVNRLPSVLGTRIG